MTEEAIFYRYADFIQKYIYDHHWNHLNPLQVMASEAVFEGGHNLLLMAGTAQGKTEAAFLPAISVLVAEKGVGILYLSPLKALINDQFLRVEDMLRYSNDPHLHLTKWHGDSQQAAKDRLLADPGGILQMTPESLEAMFCLHPERIKKLFANLRFVIIDEIHYFINSERGIHLLILLERLQKLAGCMPVRIGLSATIGNPEMALAYLDTGSKWTGKLIRHCEKGRSAMVSLTATRVGKDPFPERYIKKLLYQSKGKRALLFANSRKMTEQLIYQIRQLDMKKNLPGYSKVMEESDQCSEACIRKLENMNDRVHGIKKLGNTNDREHDGGMKYGYNPELRKLPGYEEIWNRYRIHHGSISKEIREETESLMKQENGPILTGTTTTLELGIDIGSLDEVIQAGDPPSISSMVQRLGRSGRRHGNSMLSFHLRHMEEKGEMDKLDLSLVRTMAMIELYFKEFYLEEMRQPSVPYHLMIHTILSVLCEKGCLQPPQLAASILELAVFRFISQDDLRDILLKLLEKQVLVQYDDGAIGIGNRGESLVNSQNFYAVFPGEEVMDVYCGGQLIGSSARPFRPGDCFFLAGKVWEVAERDLARHRLEVHEATDVDEEEISYAFDGWSEKLCDRKTMEKIHEILNESKGTGTTDSLVSQKGQAPLTHQSSLTHSESKGTDFPETQDDQAAVSDQPEPQNKAEGTDAHGSAPTAQNRQENVREKEEPSGEKSAIIYGYLDKEATGILEDLQQKMIRYQLDQPVAVERGSGNLLLCPAFGTRTIETIYHILKAHDKACELIYLRDLLYGIRLKGLGLREFQEFCQFISKEKYMIDYGYVTRKIRCHGKYYDLLPDHLKGKEMIRDHLDLEGAREYFRNFQ